MRFVERWTERTLLFGSDEALPPSHALLCSEMEKWARAVHSENTLVAFVKLDGGQGPWHTWSCEWVRQTEPP
jgi:hypothetical protein